MDKIDNNKALGQWQRNSSRENQQINSSFLHKHVCDFDDLSVAINPWIFSHIPKTAGTSLENYLSQLFLIQDIVHVNAPDLNKIPEVLNLKNQFPRFIAGHHPMHGLLYQLLPKQKLVHLALMREPIARILSYYNYLKSRKTHALHDSVLGMDFDTFIQQPMVELNNGQSRRLAGMLHSDEKISDHELFKCAKNVIDNCFTLVGVTEKIELFVQLIENKCGVTINRSEPKNSSNKSLKMNEINSRQLELIQKNNAADIMLYDYVFEKFSNLKV